MKYVTIVAENYDDAVKKARTEYGNSIRIHSRRDLTVRGGFLWLGKKPRVEITCYLPEAPPAFPWQQEHEVDKPTSVATAPPPPVQEKAEEPIVQTLVKEEAQPAVPPVVADRRDDLIAKAGGILSSNGFSTWFTDQLLASLQEELATLGPNGISEDEFELMLVDKIVAQVSIDRNMQLHPPRVCIVMGPTGVGKTTTIAKMAAIYGLQQRPEFKRNVHLVTIDSFRIGAFEQMTSFGEALGMAVHRIESEDEFSGVLAKTNPDDLVLVDTIGRSPRDSDLALRMKTMISTVVADEKAVFLALGATMKQRDLERTIDAYIPFGVRSVIVTKTDETDTIGDVLSVCAQRGLPLLFFTDGQRVPKDIHKASAASILALLRGFSMDFANLWTNQIDIEPSTTE